MRPLEDFPVQHYVSNRLPGSFIMYWVKVYFIQQIDVFSYTPVYNNEHHFRFDLHNKTLQVGPDVLISTKTRHTHFVQNVCLLFNTKDFFLFLCTNIYNNLQEVNVNTVYKYQS